MILLIQMFFLFQVIWSGEWLEGTGRSTGEETEQLFSYLSRFGNTTKHQSPESILFYCIYCFYFYIH